MDKNGSAKWIFALGAVFLAAASTNGAVAKDSPRGVFLTAAGLTSAPVKGGFIVHTDDTGALIPTFGAGGYLDVNLIPGPRVTAFLAEPLLQNDNKFVISGSNCPFPINNCTHYIARYTDEGVLDTTFGDATTPGRVVYNAPKGLPADSLFAQGDDHFLASRTTGPTVQNPSIIGSGLVRFDKDGHQDMTFAGTGLYAPDFFAGVKLVQDDGGIVVSLVDFTANPATLSLVRLTANGMVDPAFNGGNPVLLPASIRSFSGIVQTQGNGKYLVAGLNDTDVVLLSLENNGSTDTSYGTDGVVTLPLANMFSSATLSLLKDQHLLLAGRSADGKIALLKLKQNGETAPEFGNNGALTFGFLEGTENDTVRGVVEGDDGSITVHAWVGGVPGQRTQVAGAAHVLKHGTLDPQFGTNGTVYFPVPARK